MESLSIYAYMHIFYHLVSVHFPLLWWRPGYLNDIHGWYGRLDNKTPFVKPRGGHAAIGGIDLPASQTEEAPEGIQENLKNPKDFQKSTRVSRIQEILILHSPLWLSSAIRGEAELTKPGDTFWHYNRTFARFV